MTAMTATEWLAKWPQRCECCFGWGYATRPNGEFGHCTKCSGSGRCGRCATALGGADEDGKTPPCPACGWDFDDGEDVEGEEIC